MRQYLEPTPLLDSDHPRVIDFATRACTTAETAVERARALFYAVRDGVRYSPYHIDLNPAAMRASAVLMRGTAFCVPKAGLLAAAARAMGIPSRLGFADVRNHLATERLLRLIRTDVFRLHGYVELRLGGRWVKATPAFNRQLCERLGVSPLDFDGRHDAMLQRWNGAGEQYLEYLADRGHFDDLPLQLIAEELRTHYPALLGPEGAGADPAFTGD